MVFNETRTVVHYLLWIVHNYVHLCTGMSGTLQSPDIATAVEAHFHRHVDTII